jgi:hypothetical protein
LRAKTCVDQLEMTEGEVKTKCREGKKAVQGSPGMKRPLGGDPGAVKRDKVPPEARSNVVFVHPL